ncbi:ATP-binding protein [Pseudomonadales bacterium]|nr:ATP-binding protein [Pseudomonadales bacterium]
MPPVTTSDSTDARSTATDSVTAQSIHSERLESDTVSVSALANSLENASANSANNSLDSRLNPDSKEGLQATFELFNRMSDDLSDSYRALEGRVSALTDELDRVNLQREQEVRSKEQVTARLSNLLDLLPGGVVVLDRWGTVSQINPAGEELLTIGLEGRKWVDIIAEFFAPQKDDGHEISMKNGKRVSLSTRSLEEETGQIILLTDQTETRRLQEQLSRGQRLSALGRMVSALAHQIRTPLSAAILYAGHLSERDLTSEQTKRFSQKIVSRLNNLEQQVRDMLVFAKGDVTLSDSMTIGSMLEELKIAVDVPLSANQASLLISNDLSDTRIVCNSQTMIGALSNLVNNALQASDMGANIQLNTRRENNDIVISIEDSGCGIPENIMQRLQQEEAFVSTKSQGTGLGIAVVRAVVKAHQGEFELVSKEGRGTQASIKLPCVHAAP